MKTLNENEVRKFWEIVKPENPDEYFELRFMGKNDHTVYRQVERFAFEYPDIIVRKNTQFFIRTYEELMCILTHNSWFFLNNVKKICYAINLKKKRKDGTIDGTYECVDKVRFVFFDIDKTDHSDISDNEIPMLDERVKQIIHILRKYGLKEPTVVDSGAGRHLLYKIKPQEITLGKKLWYKKFVTDIATMMSSFDFSVDGIYDFTRVFGMPGTYNMKRGKEVCVLKHSNYVSNFVIKWCIVKKNKYNTIIYDEADLPEVKDSLEWKIITNPDLPYGDINNRVVFALKLLIKSKGIVDWVLLQDELNSRTGNNYRLDPSIGMEPGANGSEKIYSPYVILKWCKDHDVWCKKHGIEYENHKV